MCVNFRNSHHARTVDEELQKLLNIPGVRSVRVGIARTLAAGTLVTGTFASAAAISNARQKAAHIGGTRIEAAVQIAPAQQHSPDPSQSKELPQAPYRP